MTDDAARVAKQFNAPAEGYDRLIGRFLPTLAPALCEVADVRRGMRVLDVGCGPGGLTKELVRRGLNVSAIDPSSPFVDACRQRNPDADVREGFAEQLPFADDSFDATISSLVVGFMSDPAAGIREMSRVTAPGGVVVACTWDRNDMTALARFGQAMAALDPSLDGDIKLAGDTKGELRDLFSAAGLADVIEGTLTAVGNYDNFADWWEPFTCGIGPHGAYLQSVDPEHREALRLRCRESFEQPDAPFTLTAVALFASGTVSTAAA